jgi:hypothetical protein
MKRVTMILLTVILAIVVWAGVSWAGDPETNASTTTATTATTTAETPTDAKASTEAKASADAAATLKTVREKGATVDAKAREKFEAQLTASAKEVEIDAAVAGDQKVAERLAAELGMSADALIAEKNEIGTSWGQLMIAHTLKANATAEVTAKQIFDLRAEGMGWGQIAHGLGLKLGEALGAVKAEGRVARGLVKADGKVHPIHGPGSRMGANIGASAGVKAGIKGAGSSGQAKAGVDLGVGANSKTGK